MTVGGQKSGEYLFQTSQNVLETVGSRKKGEWLSSNKNGDLIKISGKLGKIWHLIKNFCSHQSVDKRTNQIIFNACEKLAQEITNTKHSLKDLKAVELKVDDFAKSLSGLSTKVCNQEIVNKVKEGFNSEITKGLLSKSSRKTVWPSEAVHYELPVKEQCEMLLKLIERSPKPQEASIAANAVIEEVNGRNLRKLKKQFPYIEAIDKLVKASVPTPPSIEVVQDTISNAVSPPLSPAPRDAVEIFASVGIVPTDEADSPQILPLSKDEIVPQLYDALGIEAMASSPMKATKKMAVDTIHALLFPLENVQARVSSNQGVTTLTVESDKFVRGDTKFKSKIPYDPMLNKDMVFTIREAEGNLIVELSDDTLLMGKVSYKKAVEIGNSASLVARNDVMKGLNIAIPQSVKSFTFSSKGNNPEDVEVHMDVIDKLPEAWGWDTKQVKSAQKWGHDKFYDTYNSKNRTLAEKFAASTWNYGCMLKESGKADVLLRMFSPWLDKGEGSDGRTKWSPQSQSEFETSNTEDEQSWVGKEMTMNWKTTVS